MPSVKQRNTQIVKINIGNVKNKAVRRRRRQSKAALAAKKEDEALKFAAYSRPYYGNGDNSAVMAAMLAGQSNFNNKLEQLENKSQLAELRRTQQQHNMQLAQLFQPTQHQQMQQHQAFASFPQPSQQTTDVFQPDTSSLISEQPEDEMSYSAPAPVSAPAEEADDAPAAADAEYPPVNYVTNRDTLLRAIDRRDYEYTFTYIKSISENTFKKYVNSPNRKILAQFLGVPEANLYKAILSR